jgi:hypothetical protein
METVTPSVCGVSAKTCVNCCVVPEMTAVSKPNSRPPSAPTTVLRIRYPLRATKILSRERYQVRGVLATSLLWKML